MKDNMIQKIARDNAGSEITKPTEQEKRCLACSHSKIEPSSPYFPRKHGGYGCDLQNYLPVSKVSKCPLP